MAKWTEIAGVIVGSIIGVTVGHSIIRSITGGNRSYQQPPQHFQQSQQYQQNYNSQPKEPLDSLKGQRFT